MSSCQVLGHVACCSLICPYEIWKHKVCPSNWLLARRKQVQWGKSLDSTAFPQYKVGWLYHCDLITLQLSQPGLGPAMVELHNFLTLPVVLLMNLYSISHNWNTFARVYSVVQLCLQNNQKVNGTVPLSVLHTLKEKTMGLVCLAIITFQQKHCLTANSKKKKKKVCIVYYFFFQEYARISDFQTYTTMLL